MASGMRRTMVRFEGRRGWAMRAGFVAVALFVGVWAAGVLLVGTDVQAFLLWELHAAEQATGISRWDLLYLVLSLDGILVGGVLHVGAVMISAFALIARTHGEVDWQSFRGWRRAVVRAISCGFMAAPTMLGAYSIGAGALLARLLVDRAAVDSPTAGVARIGTMVVMVLIAVRILLPAPMLAFLLAERPRMGMWRTLRAYWRLVPHLATPIFLLLSVAPLALFGWGLALAWMDGFQFPGVTLMRLAIAVGGLILGYLGWYVMAVFYLHWRQRLPEFAPLAVAMVLPDDADEEDTEAGRVVLANDAPIPVGTRDDGRPVRAWPWAVAVFGAPMLLTAVSVAYHAWLNWPAPDAALAAEFEAKYPAPSTPSDASVDWRRVIESVPTEFAYEWEWPATDAEVDAAKQRATRVLSPNVLAAWQRAMTQPSPSFSPDGSFDAWLCIFTVAELRLVASIDDPAGFREAFGDTLALVREKSAIGWWDVEVESALALHLHRCRATLTVADLAALDAVIAGIIAGRETPEIAEIRAWVRNFRAYEKALASDSPNVRRQISRGVGVVIEYGLQACPVLEREQFLANAQWRALKAADPAGERYFAEPKWLHRRRWLSHYLAHRTSILDDGPLVDASFPFVRAGREWRSWLAQIRLKLRLVGAEKLTGCLPATVADLPPLPAEFAPFDLAAEWTPAEQAAMIIIPWPADAQPKSPTAHTARGFGFSLDNFPEFFPPR